MKHKFWLLQETTTSTNESQPHISFRALALATPVHISFRALALATPVQSWLIRKTDDMDGRGAEVLAERVGSGAMSIHDSARIAAAFVCDGARGVANRQFARSQRERDMWRWIHLPFRGYSCKLPLLSSGRPGQKQTRSLVHEDVCFVLPSDVFHEVHARGLESEIFLGLGSLEVVGQKLCRIDRPYLQNDFF